MGYRRFLATALIGMTIAFVANAQTLDRRIFELSSTSGTIEQSCGFRARANLGNSLTRGGYQLRLPDWNLSVSVLSGSGITNAIADNTLNAAADLLKRDQGGADVNCCIDLTRNAGVSVFQPPASMVGGVITTAAESSAVFNVNADIKVVNAISFCGQAGTYAGCADGNSIITVNAVSNLVTMFTNPATVSHEVGHWSGLDHVAQTCQPTPGQCGTCGDCADGWSARVMYCRICNGPPVQGIITASQCLSFQGAAQ